MLETREQVVRAGEFIDDLMEGKSTSKSKPKCDCAATAIMAYILMKNGTWEDTWNGIVAADQACDIPGSQELLSSANKKEELLNQNHEEEYRKLGLTEESRERFDLPSYKLWATLINKTTDDWLKLLEKCHQAPSKQGSQRLCR